MDDHSFWLRMEDEQTQDDGSQPLPEGLQPPSSLPAGVDEKGEDKDGKDPGSDQPQTGNGTGDQTDQNNAGQNPPESTEDEHSQQPRQLLSQGELDAKDKEWEKNAQRIRAEIESTGKEASDETGSLERLLAYHLRKRTSYKEFLRRFRIHREEARIDPDSFDYGFYYYGMQMYHNMPLIEENEYRESNKVEQLVIAIDTSASCQPRLVQQFLNETASILLGTDSFFTKVEIHIVECDDQIQNDIVIRHPEDMKRYADGFSLKGGFGTDFRPVFRYVEELRSRGELQHLKGLMYFTDGYGIYPKKPTDYQTAFVFWKDEDLDDSKVPDWALKLYI